MTIDKWMDKEVVVHMYNRILLSHKKEWMWVIWIEVDEPRACSMEWSKTEREKQVSYTNIYIWDLEKWYWWTYLKGRNRDADVEDSLLDTEGKGEGGMNRESSTGIYTLSYVN